MSRARLLRLSATFANTLSSTRQLGLNSLISTQVTHFSNLTQSPPISTPRLPNTNYLPINFNQNLFFSSKSESFVDVMLSSNNWSIELENELEDMNPKLTHESIIYVLFKLNGNPQFSFDFHKWVSVRNGFSPSFVAYGVLLRSLSCKEFVEKFWVVVGEMKEKGVYIDPALMRNIVHNLKMDGLHEAAKKWSDSYYAMIESDVSKDVAKNVVELILGCDWSESVEKKLKRMLKFPVSINFLLKVLSEYSDLWRQPLRALKFFEWVGSNGGYEHDSVTYNAMLKVLGQSESIHEFWDLVKRVKIEGFEMDIDNYTKISRRIPDEDALKLFEFMMDGPYKPSEQHCAHLLKQISLDFDPDINMVNRVVNKFVAAGNTPTKSVYDGIHRSLTKAGKFDEAKKVVEDMRIAGYEPDNITYSQEVFGLCKQKRFEEANNVLEHMEAEGCVPDIKTWTILIQGYCNANQVDQALICFAKMIDKNVDPDADTLEVLLNGFLAEKKLLGAYRFLIEMVSKARLKPWQATYKLLIEKLAEVGKLDEALQLVRVMKQQGYPPFADPVTQYISKSGTTDDAKKVLKVLSVNGITSTAAYVRVIIAFLDEGRHSEAKDLLYDSPRRVREQKTIRKMFGSDQASKSEQSAAKPMRSVSE